MTTPALLALAALLLAAPPAAPDAEPPAAAATAEICAVPNAAPRRDPLLAFLARLEETAAQSAERPLTPARKALLLASLDDKIRRARTRRDYLNRRLSDLRRDLSDIETFERRADAVRARFETATTEVIVKESPRTP